MSKESNMSRYALAKEQSELQATLTPKGVIQSLEREYQDILAFITQMNDLRPAMGPGSELWVQSIEFDPEFCAGEPAMRINQSLEDFYG